METVLRISGIAIIGIFASLLLKERYRTAAISASLAAVVIISSVILDGSIRTSVEAVFGFVNGGDFSQYALTLLKALGIAYITTLTENVCREAGESSLAFAVELAGKAQLIVLSLPLLASLLEIAGKLL